MTDHQNKIAEFIQNIYTSECKGKQNDIDKCNCFLHSYSYNGGPETNNFQTLKPYIEYVASIHPIEMELTISLLKEYAKSFSSSSFLSLPTIDFSNANF